MCKKSWLVEPKGNPDYQDSGDATSCKLAEEEGGESPVGNGITAMLRETQGFFLILPSLSLLLTAQRLTHLRCRVCINKSLQQILLISSKFFSRKFYFNLTYTQSKL